MMMNRFDGLLSCDLLGGGSCLPLPFVSLLLLVCFGGFLSSSFLSLALGSPSFLFEALLVPCFPVFFFLCFPDDFGDRFLHLVEKTLVSLLESVVAMYLLAEMLVFELVGVLGTSSLDMTIVL